MEIGDKVVITGTDDNDQYTEYIGLKGVITRVDYDEDNYHRIELDTNKFGHDYIWRQPIHFTREFIPDTKLARKLYKNTIKEIRDGKIYF
jgi:hypothetical protein